MTDVTLDDAAFDDLYARVIEPALAPHEAERKRLVDRFWKAFKLGAVIGALVAIPMMFKTGDGDAFVFGVMVAAVFAGIAYIPLARFEARCKAAALGALAEAICMTYVVSDFEPPRVRRLRELDLLDAWDDATFEDLFSGTRRGSAFQLYEARMTTGSGKEQKTVFAGQLIRVAFPKSFLGTTVVNRQGARRWRAKGFERVGLEWPQFERVFEVFGADQVEARYLVHPVFMEKLMAIETANAGKNIRCAFDEGDLLIVVEGSNLFEIIEVFKPLPDRDKTRQGVDQIAQVLGLIDAVMAPPENVYASKSSSPPSSST